MRLLPSLFALGMSLGMARAYETKMDQSDDNRQRCTGMYSKASWGGPVNPYITTVFMNDTVQPGTDPIVSLVIFEWKDVDLIGIPNPEPNLGNDIVLCHQAQIDAGLCKDSQMGEFILAQNHNDVSTNIIYTQAVHLNNPRVPTYEIKNTGYYCILTEKFSNDDYELVAVFRNAYGELPATQVPKLPFYGGITLVYALVAVFWGFLYYQHRHDILAVQNYITAILVFLVVEMLVTWAYFDYLNRNGANIGSKIFMVVVAVLNAGRNSFSFFLLLIVCMGYGVVKPTLGRTMIYVRWLALAHFIFGLVYAITSLLITPDNAGPFVLLVVLPLAGTLTAFYVWTLNSLNFTLKDLRERKQHAKESMYRKLWWCILLSIFVIFAFFFFSSFSFASVSDPDYVPFHWKTRWFILDGWLNLVYFADVAFIAYVWRPTANNRRFAMSDEIAQDDDGTFEIADIGNPDESDSDEEADIGGRKTTTSNGQTGVSSSSADAAGASGALSSGSRPQPARNLPRESLDGETIFAVGDDDKFSDDDDDEDAKLVRPKP